MKNHKQKQHLQGSELLDNSPSHLLHKVLQIALDIYNEETGDSGLTQRQYALLLAADTPEGLTQTDLVRITGIDRSTLADMVTRLTAKGLLARERSSTDARANLVTLSDEGRQALDAIKPKVTAADARILGLLSPPKRESFLKLLHRLTTPRDAGSDQHTEAHKKGKKDGKKKKGKKGGKKAKAALPFPKEVTLAEPEAPQAPENTEPQA
ncbi:MAG: MarR family transcriptional regulator [Asticcacaulis sp.]